MRSLSCEVGEAQAIQNTHRCGEDCLRNLSQGLLDGWCLFWVWDEFETSILIVTLLIIIRTSAHCKLRETLYDNL